MQGQTQAGGPGAPLSQGQLPHGLVGELCPQLSPQRIIAMQQRKQQEMAQPHVFLHTAHPRRPVRSLAFIWGDGGGRVGYVWGGG